MQHEDYLPSVAYEGKPAHAEKGFVVFQDEKTNLYFFAMTDADGKVLLKSEGYPQITSRENGLQSVLKNRINKDFYSVKKSEEGKFYLSLRAGNHKEIARSSTFSTQPEAFALIPFTTGAQVRTMLRPTAGAAMSFNPQSIYKETVATKEDDYLAVKEYAGHPPTGQQDFTDLVAFRHANGQFYFVWYDDAGNVLMRSEGYPTAASRDSDRASVAKNRDLEERYGVESKLNRYFTFLKDANQQEIARSGAFPTELAAKTLYPSARKAAFDSKMKANASLDAARFAEQAKTESAAEMNRLNAEATAKAAEATRLKAEADAKMAAEETVRLKAVADAKARVEAEVARIKAEAEAKSARLEAEADAKAAAEIARLKAEADAKAAAEAETARLKAEADAKAAAEAEVARLKAQTDAKVAAEAARLKAEADAKTAAEVARLKAEADAKAAAEAARLKAEADAKAADVSKVRSFANAPRTGMTDDAPAAMPRDPNDDDDYLTMKEYVGHTAKSGYKGLVPFKHPNGKYYFVWYDDAGNVLMRSEGFPTAAARDNDMIMVDKNRDIEDRFSTMEKMNRYFTILRGGNRQEIARSGPKNTELEAKALYPSARKLASDEQIRANRLKTEQELAAKIAVSAPMAFLTTQNPQGSEKNAADDDDYLSTKEYEAQTDFHPKQGGIIVFQHPRTKSHYFSVMDMNTGKVLLRSEGYPNPETRENDIEAVIRNRDIKERYIHKQLPTGQHYLSLQNGNKQEIGRTPVYQTEAALWADWAVLAPNNKSLGLTMPWAVAGAGVANTLANTTLPTTAIKVDITPKSPEMQEPTTVLVPKGLGIGGLHAVEIKDQPKVEAPKVVIERDAPMLGAVGLVGGLVGNLPSIPKPEIKVEMPAVPVRGLGLGANLEVPKIEMPKVEIPKVEMPKVEIPKVEIPKIEMPKMEVPKVEIPKIEVPKVEISKIEVPKVEMPKVEVPKIEMPKVETPKVEMPKVEVPKVEIPKVIAPKVETAKGKLQKSGTPEPDKIFTKVEALAEVAPTTVDAKPVAAGSSRSNWWLPIMALALLGMGAIFYKIMENRKAAVPSTPEVTTVLPDATLKPIESVNAPTEPPPISNNSMADAGTGAKPGDYNTKVIPKGASTTVATPNATVGLESKGGAATNAIAAKPATKTSGSSTRGGAEAGTTAKTTTGTVVARGKAAGVAPGKLNWLLFDFDKSDLRSQSMSELDKLAAVLKKNTTAKAELDGHTDFKGGEDYNHRLSEHRAENAKKYLISKGISEDRIVLKTHGKSNPYTENKTEEGRQLNRRVEIRAIDASGNAIETSVAPKAGANQK